MSALTANNQSGQYSKGTIVSKSRCPRTALIPRTDLHGWKAIGAKSDKSNWTIRAACLKAAQDSKGGHNDSDVRVLAEAFGMTLRHALKTIQDYRLLLSEGCKSSDTPKQIPQMVVRAARENTIDAPTAITALADYRERKAADPKYSVRQFAEDIPKGTVRKVKP